MASSNWVCCKFTFLKCTRCFGIQKVLKVLGIFFSIHLITFHLILPYALRDHPYSSYFSPTWNVYQRALGLNEDRIKMAEGYLDTVNAARSREMYSNTNRAKFVIGIVTVARVSYEKSVPQPRYLTQVVAKVHKLLAESPSKLDYQLFICNVDDQGSSHSEAIYLSNFTRMVTKNENGNSNFHSRQNRWEREKLDYNYCLEQAWLYDSKYAILIQDDAVPHSNFVEVLEYLVSNHLEYRIQGGRLSQNLEKWAWIKLNFPENLAGFLRNWRFVLEWISISAMLASIFTLFMTLNFFELS
ncbi:transmembrane protein 246-like isoform X2 [Anneissia japonica]|uniref:transmembrane protein 246-like isoform X2 n=1 Tax=Anneissia japonica TaxID=1529436 RepID=UPI0014258D0D|nr:transmembrane protein 246-like isoform X2 [Anneissia japonica]